MNAPSKPTVVRVLRANSDEFRRAVLRRIFDTHPETRLWFPPNEAEAHTELTFVLCYILERANADGSLPAAVENSIAALARDHRKFGVTTAYIPSVIDIIGKTMREFCEDLPYEEVNGAHKVIRAIGATMMAAVRSEEEAGNPSWSDAEVMDVEKLSRRFTAVRLLAKPPVDYQPGQWVPVSTPYLKGRWKNLFPTMPSNTAGMIEFHVFCPEEADDITRLLASTSVGDTWHLGAAHGGLNLTLERDLLMIAHGDGLAPLRAILLNQMMLPNPPRAHLYFGAESPGELYELRGLWQLATSAPWLSVTPVVESETDPWWVHATDASVAPRGLHLQEVGTLQESVTRWGDWADRDVLISADPARVDAITTAMLKAGTPMEQIHVIPRG